MPPNTKLNHKFVLTRDDSSLSVFMSFGLLNTLSRYFENPQDLDAIFDNADVRIALLTECFAERNEKGEITSKIPPTALEITTEEAWEFFGWVQEHLADFFTQALKRATNGRRTLLEKMKASTLQSTEGGSPT